MLMHGEPSLSLLTPLLTIGNCIVVIYNRCMKNILQKLLEFREKRDWVQFHSPQNIAKSIVLEAAEILEVFQWKSDEALTDKEKEELGEEMADVYNWLILLSHDLQIDLEQVALKKIEKNEKKYPVAKTKGIATKYTKL